MPFLSKSKSPFSWGPSCLRKKEGSFPLLAVVVVTAGEARQNESKSGLGSQGRGLPGPGGKEDVERRPGARAHHLTADSGWHLVLAC